MKLGKLEISLIAVAAAAVCFTAGYFSGRGASGDVNITVNRAPEDTVQSSGAVEEDKVNINTAARWELMSLPGIGEALANRIIEYRDENGPFSVTEELMNVRGIGESLFDSIEQLITV